jgi:AAA family ATP:ADP antiporter
MTFTQTTTPSMTDPHHPSTEESHLPRVRGLQRLVDVRHEEKSALLWSFAYFFCLLAAYYILRPLRDEMGIAGGVENLQWAFTGTFIATLATVPLFGWAAARFPRAKLLPLVYLFFIANILIFFALFQLEMGQVYFARIFFIWTSVFNLFVISVFWSFMADLFTNAQARRLFGFIAAGGSAGAVLGPALTGLLAAPLGPINLLLVSAVLLAGAVVCIRALGSCTGAFKKGKPYASAESSAIGGSIFAGVKRVFASPYMLGICCFMLLYTVLATFLYLVQAQVVAEASDDSATRTALFAWIDFSVNVLTIGIQITLTGRIISWLGVPLTLALIPILMAGGFMGLALAPMLPVLVAFQVMRRAGEYAIARPAREVLFTVVDVETKYKAKNFIDTVVYRGGDAISSWIYAALAALGLSLSGIAAIAVPIAMLLAAVGLGLGNRQEVLTKDANAEGKAVSR